MTNNKKILIKRQNLNNMCIIIKLFIFLFTLQKTLVFKKYKKKVENELNRFIKYNRKNISTGVEDKQLFPIINYVKSLRDKSYKKIYYKIKSKPKISFISPVFNQDNYLPIFISSIQNQKLEDYEMIFIDDFSVDKSVQLLLEKMKLDERIKLIKNKKNMGALYSRYIGQKFSKANYSIFLDCDDIVLENGIFESYKHIIKNNLEIVQFLTVWQEQNSIFIKTSLYKYERIISKPILPYIFYYDNDNHKGKEMNYALWDKLVKTELMNKAFEFIGYNYLYQKKIIIHNDLIILFSLFQKANSYQYINEIGYYYIKTNKNSTTKSWNIPNKRNEIINSLFTNIEFLYNKTNDTYLDKCFCIYVVHFYFRHYQKLFNNLSNNEYYFFKNITDKLLNLNYIPENEKLGLALLEMSLLNVKEN